MRKIFVILAVAVMGAATQLPAAADATSTPGYCKEKQVFEAKDLPEKIHRRDCDLIGSTIVDEETGIVEPSPVQQSERSEIYTDGTSDMFAVAVDSNGEQIISGVGDKPVKKFHDSKAEPSTTIESNAINYDFETSGDVFTMANAETGECEDDFYRTIHGGEHDTHEWYFNRSTIPTYFSLSNDTVVQRVREGGAHITHGDTDCSTSLTESIGLSYKGDTSTRPNMSKDACAPSGFDGQNTVAFGDRKPHVAATTCSNIVAFSELSESDMEINNDKAEKEFFAMNTKPDTCNSRVDLEGVVTHERGHTFGLDDLDYNNHPKLTMRNAIFSGCSIEMRSLGLGDIKGLNDLY